MGKSLVTSVLPCSLMSLDFSFFSFFSFFVTFFLFYIFMCFKWFSIHRFSIIKLSKKSRKVEKGEFEWYKILSIRMRYEFTVHFILILLLGSNCGSSVNSSCLQGSHFYFCFYTYHIMVLLQLTSSKASLLISLFVRIVSDLTKCISIHF